MDRRTITGTLSSVVLGGGIAALIGAAQTDTDAVYFDYLLWSGWSAIAIGAFGFVLLLLLKERAKVSDKTESDEGGDDNTVVGRVPKNMKLGSRNTIVNFDDGNGNCIVPGGVSIGANAGYDPTGTIIGSGAGANLGKKRDGD